MVLTTINVESDVRRQYNRRVLFCIRIRGAALLIGLWDLLVHSVVLCALIFMFRQPPRIINDVGLTGVQSFRPQEPPVVDSVANPEQSTNVITHNKNFLSSNILLNRILEKHNVSHAPMGLNTRNFYSNLDLMTIKWAASLNRQDKCVVFFVVFSATILIIAHICGILTNKPSYIVPYFLIKVFNVIVSILSLLGFYAYMPDIAIWLRMQPDFPFKQNLLELDTQTLQLVVFAFLLFVILAKLYIAAIIWYCYGYITALTMARTIGTFTAHTDGSQAILGEMYSPPKYEEAIKSNYEDQENYSPPPYTPLLHSSIKVNNNVSVAFFFCLLLTITTSITPVPGIIDVRLLPDNQVSSGVYAPSSTVRYLLEFENVPITDDVVIGVEIRGSNPNGGARGYITTARAEAPIKEFIQETNNLLEFQLTPNEIFAGYSWFLRPYVFFANEPLVSTNMMNAGASEMFTVLKE